ncbi:MULTISPECIES: RNA polymerase-binding protein RbpA [Micromonospora]|uniref:RNA polymerase-binding protein RbpA n=1 Tax=Micromonospora chalcea TaxID=1874 RepID=A0ABX9Y4B3_MICCH|nr:MULTISPECIES: RNA polymerase-binding protein RbpA [Micromonospora]EWM68673.1 electron transport protein [Micromonospora sp. M42]MBC8990738.1 RNA polymerase-binding protein RbpA [Micromonospora chalcea]MBQ1064561.1 RNA polymerase-binding protein RbpA [Micromonospora sp. C41]MCK1805889.1 RNA polymerase-binding protein RbpA [Micromonospora sp. R42106]MCK1831607.1 RNA polymerase-binding protein RbpA [Micromonospora sp. R42003]
MPSNNVIRGTRIGSAPERFDQRVEPAPRRPVVYWCRHGHRVEFLIAAEAETPATWECPRCGEPAGPDPGDPPGRQRAEPYKTHLAYVQERRTPEEGEALLAEALDALRRRRGRD